MKWINILLQEHVFLFPYSPFQPYQCDCWSSRTNSVSFHDVTMTLQHQCDKGLQLQALITCFSLQSELNHTAWQGLWKLWKLLESYFLPIIYFCWLLFIGYGRRGAVLWFKLFLLSRCRSSSHDF